MFLSLSTFCSLMDSGQKLNMIFSDFHNTQSGHRVKKNYPVKV